MNDENSQLDEIYLSVETEQLKCSFHVRLLFATSRSTRSSTSSLVFLTDVRIVKNGQEVRGVRYQASATPCVPDALTPRAKKRTPPSSPPPKKKHKSCAECHKHAFLPACNLGLPRRRMPSADVQDQGLGNRLKYEFA